MKHNNQNNIATFVMWSGRDLNFYCWTVHSKYKCFKNNKIYIALL